MEFASNNEREKAFALLKDGPKPKDGKGAELTIKRARTSQQRDRNDRLFKAKDLITKSCKYGEEVKIDFEHRQILCKNVPAFIQNKDDAGGNFLPPFEQLYF